MSDLSAGYVKGIRVAAAALVLAGSCYLAGRSAPTDVLARSYGPSLSQVSADWSGDSPSHTENLWLSKADSPTKGTRKALTIGDRVSIGTAEGISQRFEVTGVELIESDALATPGSTIQIVTGRNEGASNGSTVRFIFAIEPPAIAPATAKPEKVL